MGLEHDWNQLRKYEHMGFTPMEILLVERAMERERLHEGAMLESQFLDILWEMMGRGMDIRLGDCYFAHDKGRIRPLPYLSYFRRKCAHLVEGIQGPEYLARGVEEWLPYFLPTQDAELPAWARFGITRKGHVAPTYGYAHLAFHEESLQEWGDRRAPTMLAAAAQRNAWELAFSDILFSASVLGGGSAITKVLDENIPLAGGVQQPADPPPGSAPLSSTHSPSSNPPQGGEGGQGADPPDHVDHAEEIAILRTRWSEALAGLQDKEVAWIKEQVECAIKCELREATLAKLKAAVAMAPGYREEIEGRRAVGDTRREHSPDDDQGAPDPDRQLTHRY